MSQNLLKIENMCMHYPQIGKVLDNISLELKQGEVASLLGSSASGKTSLLRAIAGFEKVTSGKIYLSDKLVSSQDVLLNPEKRKVAFIFQDYALFPHLTVKQNIEFSFSKKNQMDIMRFCKPLAIDNILSRYPGEISGGQQQRVAIARALVSKPDLLLLDEPFSNLDVNIKRQLSIELRDFFKSENVSAVMVTHDPNEAFAISDWVGVLKDKELVQWESPYNIYHNPKTPFVAMLSGRGSLISTQIESIDFKNKTASLNTPLGKISGDYLQDIDASRDNFKLLIRPDDLVHDDDSSFLAKVVNKTFFGAYYLYQLELKSGDLVESYIPSHHDHHIGSSIGFRVEVDHLVLF